MENILSFKNVSYSYNSNNTILEDINVDFQKGKFYTIIGPSGSGKTTFISLACGLDNPSNGDILYRDDSLNNISLEKYRNKYVSIIFQGYNLLNYMSAIENITSSMNIKGIRTNNNKQFAIDMLNRVGLTAEQGMQKTLTLSGGQQQRVAIARALCCNSDLIIADEPTGNLDEKTSEEIICLFKDIVKTENKTIIMVTHDNKIASMSDDTYIVKDRKVDKLFYR
ncbi:ABC transporter ATP-binding protein [Paraclostridium ghonii]|uniref:ABC transport system ATP-binding protein n=1 Tax=Paraclostridium ghonii TaxID=29358 RepID=A0ABU0N2S3_9FIRM|nr:ABC transporter ATP-binding protein [Paeniclostridium ghonii]MDQ0557123.1 putative ABC transport system ATP-binding protein [Paeniclostridium ghonii]